MSIQLDRGSSKTVSFGSDVNNPYNFSVYSVKSLPYSNHTFDLVPQSFSGEGYHDFEFDYAVVNNTDAHAVPSTTSSSAPFVVTSKVSSAASPSNGHAR